MNTTEQKIENLLDFYANGDMLGSKGIYKALDKHEKMKLKETFGIVFFYDLDGMPENEAYKLFIEDILIA